MINQNNLKAVLVADLYESVRLMHSQETTVIEAWQTLTQRVKVRLATQLDGRMVRSLGDGFLMDFDSVANATEFATFIHSISVELSESLSVKLQLRVGIHFCSFVVGQDDIYGNGVNLTARIAGLAEPGQTVVSADARDHLVDGLDALVTDMGYSYLKHFDEPVRTFSLSHKADLGEPKADGKEGITLRPTIAVIAFSNSLSSPDSTALGDIVADGLIARLTSSQNVNIISRLSSAALRDNGLIVSQSKQQLQADFVIHGTISIHLDSVLISAQMTRTSNHTVVWAERVNCKVAELFDVDSVALGTLSQRAQDALLLKAIESSHVQSLPTLQGYSLLLSGIGLMHRSNQSEFDRSRNVLEHLQERYPRVSELRAWMGKWYVLRVLRGMSTDRDSDARRAISETSRALAIDPRNSLALAIEGYIYCQLMDRIDTASERIGEAVTRNPNESLAWLLKSVISAAHESNLSAVAEAQHAQRLSPIDPIRYFYKMLIGNAFLVAGDCRQAIEYCEDSIRLNRCHSPTIRILITAQYEAGLFLAAKKSLSHLLELENDLTVDKYLAGGNRENRNRKRCAAALKGLGLKQT